jgi:hypothetical protein
LRIRRKRISCRLRSPFWLEENLSPDTCAAIQEPEKMNKAGHIVLGARLRLPELCLKTNTTYSDHTVSRT